MAVDLSEAADVSSGDLPVVKQPRVHLAGINLKGADLSGLNLQGANLFEADLRHAKLTYVALDNACLDGADLRDATVVSVRFQGATFRHARLEGVDLTRANLCKANFFNARMRRARLSSRMSGGTIFIGADLRGADMRGAALWDADFTEANLSRARLDGADLSRAIFVKTVLKGAELNGCRVFGASVWDVDLAGAKQQGLLISDGRDASIAVDNLDVAQFVYLMLNNSKLRTAIDTIGRKGVLILGRFTEERLAVLRAIGERLRALGFVPIIFSFERPKQRDFTETVKILAGLSKFIVADITNPSSSPLELQATMPEYMIPFAPIIQDGEEPFAMFRDLKRKYGEWVLDVLKYDTVDHLVAALDLAVVKPALAMSDRLLVRRTERLRSRHVREYLSTTVGPPATPRPASRPSRRRTR